MGAGAVAWRETGEQDAALEQFKDDTEQWVAKLEQAVRDLLAAGNTNAAVYVAILLGDVCGSSRVLHASHAAAQRGRREEAAIQRAALRRWGSPKQRQKIDEEIIAVAEAGVCARGAKEAVHVPGLASRNSGRSVRPKWLSIIRCCGQPGRSTRFSNRFLWEV